MELSIILGLSLVAGVIMSAWLLKRVMTNSSNESLQKALEENQNKR